MDNHLSVKLSLSFMLIVAMLGNALVRSEASDIHPPGQLVKVNGRNMHINCMGNKSPTVILDSGAGGFSLEWDKIQQTLSKHTRVCAYDRAGYGWSDMGNLPRTTKKIAHELHTLLQNAGTHPPYIMVGHSFGGFTAQYFARHFNNQVVGIVLIDSSHEEQVYRLPEYDTDAPINSMDQERRTIVTKAVLHEHFPAENAARAYQLMNQWHSLMTWREEMASYAISSRQLRDIHHEPINDIPLRILSRGKRVWPYTEYGNRMETIWIELQKEFGNLSNNSRHIIAKESGHSIHLDQPKLTIEVIHEVLQAFKHRH